ncbi:MAG: L-histidine N(alpha)-methyltransferase [Gemmatimonadetes bacterium]|nr:L-histidine N(alpha)-methyltransferase [Gemmatimonadota bacterium]
MTSDPRTATQPPETQELRELRDEVWAGLEARALSSRWFYDHRGSELFEAITRLPEYYPTRTERSLLEEHAAKWMAELRPGIVVELGAGSARKTRILLDALQRERPGAVYVPLDVSAAFLDATARELRAEYPDLRIEPEVADLLHPLDIADHGAGPTLFAFLGSTLGNFGPEAAAGLLGRIRAEMDVGDTVLLGVDLRPGPSKSRAELEAAYNDSQGVTAEFNRNMLHVLNERAGTDFDPVAFRHRAFYAEADGRIEMHLVAGEPTRVHVPGRGSVTFSRGESIRTEISAKYDPRVIDDLFRAAGLERTAWVPDGRGRYAMVFARPRA